MMEGGCVQNGDGPCRCPCHDGMGAKCFGPCCSFAGMSRTEAATVAMMRAGAKEVSVDDPVVKKD